MGCIFSACRGYRYVLTREWGDASNRCIFIGLNPSTADEVQDDPTIRRCIGFAKRLGCGTLYMLNIFAFRAADPKVMKAVTDPVGPDNDWWIKFYCQSARVVVAAWGAHGAYLGRGQAVRKILSFREVHCLGTTKAGHPRHPLYLKRDTPLMDFNLLGFNF